jgi:drug/metabolite transporter (DMT)-like permease
MGVMGLTPKTWSGAALALLSAALFGASTPLAKVLLGDVSPWLLAGLLYLFSGCGLFVLDRIRRITRGRSSEAPLRRADLPWLAAVCVAGGIVGPVLLLVGLNNSSASAAALLLNLEGVFTLAIAWIVFRENVDLRIGLGAMAIVCGALLLSWHGTLGTVGSGTLLIAAACLAWAIDNNLTRKLSSADPLQVAMIKGLVAGAVNVILALLLGASWPAASILTATAIIGFLGYGVSIVLFVLALRHLGAARTSAYFSVAPFVGAAIAIAMFGEPITVAFIAAAILIAIGLYFHLAEHHAHVHVHDSLKHEHAMSTTLTIATGMPQTIHRASRIAMPMFMRGSSIATRIIPICITGIRTEPC